ncbi:hypothetical protein ACQKWADRAFT_315368 [Trichoderma austrokoningii]
MFEGQCDSSSSLTAKAWTGGAAAAPNDAAAYVKRQHHQSLHNHADIKDVEAKHCPCPQTWAIAPQTDDVEKLAGSNSNKQRVAFADLCEKSTQTDVVDCGITQHAWLDHSAGTRPDASIPALRQQLQDARQDLNRWKERSLAAERKARLFQKFTTRVRRLHGSLMTGGSAVVREESDAEGSYLVHSVRLKEALGGLERGDETSASMMYGSPSETAAVADSALPVHGMDGVASPRDDEDLLKLRLAMVELWMVVQELLRLEDEEASSSSSPSSSSSSSQQLASFTEDESLHF